MIQLRDYQQEYIKALRERILNGKKRLILCAPTGAGKTVMFSFMVKNHLEKGGNVLVLTHRGELLNQANGTFEKFGIKGEIITAKSKPNLNDKLHVAMVETVNSRIEKYKDFLLKKTMIIVDEAHLQNFTKIFPYLNENAIVIGATATPYRKPKEIQLGVFYQEIIKVIDTIDLVHSGALVDAMNFAQKIDLKGLKKTQTDYDTSDYYTANKTYVGVVEQWQKHALNTKTILFASNIKNSIEACSEFVKHGFNAKHIDGTTSENERKNVFKWFNENEDAILCNCGILTAGFDQHDIKTVVLYRATTSLPLYLQMVGRGSRLSESKNHFKVLDFGNNIERLGVWQTNRDWDLFYEKKQKESVAPLKECSGCGCLLFLSVKICPNCGNEFSSNKEKEKADLVEYVDTPKRKYLGKKISKLTVNDCYQLDIDKRYKPSFIWRVLRTKGEESIKEFAKLKNYKQGWIYSQIKEIKNNNVGFKDFRIKKN